MMSQTHTQTLTHIKWDKLCQLSKSQIYSWKTVAKYILYAVIRMHFIHNLCRSNLYHCLFSRVLLSPSKGHIIK